MLYSIKNFFVVFLYAFKLFNIYFQSYIYYQRYIFFALNFNVKFLRIKIFIIKKIYRHFIANFMKYFFDREEIL